MIFMAADENCRSTPSSPPNKKARECLRFFTPALLCDDAPSTGNVPPDVITKAYRRHVRIHAANISKMLLFLAIIMLYDSGCTKKSVAACQPRLKCAPIPDHQHQRATSSALLLITKKCQYAPASPTYGCPSIFALLLRFLHCFSSATRSAGFQMMILAAWWLDKIRCLFSPERQMPKKFTLTCRRYAVNIARWAYMLHTLLVMFRYRWCQR